MNSFKKKMEIKKVLYCSNFYPPNIVGGAELIAHFHAKALRALGYELTVFTGQISINQKKYSVIKDIYEGIPIHRINLHPENYSPMKNNFSNKNVEGYFKRLLEEFKPDLVHFHHVIGLSVGLIHIAKSKGVKTIVTFPDHWGFCYKNTLIKQGTEICNNFNDCSACMRFINDESINDIPIRLRNDFLKMQLEDADVFISSSEYLKSAYIRAGFPEKKIKVVWNGIDYTKFQKSKSNKPTNKYIDFTFVGYFGIHKGVETLLKALPLLINKKKVRINLVGEGSRKEYYIRLLKELKCSHMVKFWGKVDNTNINQVYSGTDILILPSICPENQPTTIVEAMASSLPVIASRIGGIPELVEHGVTGYLFQPGNHQDLANKMNYFITDTKNLKKFGQNGFQKIKTATINNQVSKLIDIYNDKTFTKSYQNPKKLVVIAGNKLELQLRDAIESISTNADYDTSYHFVMSKWLDNDQLEKANIICLNDIKSSMNEIKIGRKNKIPFLYPTNNQELSKIISSDKRISYRNTQEVMQCFKILPYQEQINDVNHVKTNSHFLKLLNKILLLNNEDFIKKTFILLLNREPDSTGVNYYQKLIYAGISKINVFEMIMSSDEVKFLAQQPIPKSSNTETSLISIIQGLFAYDNQEFIINIYLQILSRKPSDQEIHKYLTTPISNFQSKWNIFMNILSSKEVRANLIK